MLGDFGLIMPVKWPSSSSISCKESGKRSNTVNKSLRHPMLIEPCAVHGTSSGFQRLPAEVFLGVVLQMFDRAQPVGRLATCNRSLWQATRSSTDSQGRLLTTAVCMTKLHIMEDALQRVSFSNIQVLKVDLSCEERKNLRSDEIQASVQLLGESLRSMSQLRVLAVRLASFDAKMERIRLGRRTWEALTRGLAGLGHHGRLRTLELSSMAIKASQATQPVLLPADDFALGPCAYNEEFVLNEPPDMTRKPSLSFLGALAKLTMLEELLLTYDEIFSTTAQLLPPVIERMPALKILDLTRNHIPRQVMQQVREDLPERVTLEGDDLQTFFFY